MTLEAGFGPGKLLEYDEVLVLGTVFVSRRVAEARGRRTDEVGADLARRWGSPAAPVTL